jgi:hypothetical protein
MTAQPPPEHTKKAEDKARKHDPHGTAPATNASQEKPAAYPTSDRQETETAGEQSGKEGTSRP